MSFAEVLSQIPHLTPEQRRELLRRVLEAEDGPAGPSDSFGTREVDGLLLLVGPRIVRQAEVEAILEELP
jgi:hypothetical protein